MHYVYDFDSTLYATTDLWERWLAELANVGIDREAATAPAEGLFQTGFTPEVHARALGVDEKDLKRLVKAIYKYQDKAGPELLYDDVRPFLEERAGTFRQTILTFGDSEYQHRKVASTGIDRIVDDVRIAGPDYAKAAQLREMIEQGSEAIMLVEDSVNQLMSVYDAGLPVELIRVKREGARHTEPHPGDDEHWRCVISLEEIEMGE